MSMREIVTCDSCDLTIPQDVGEHVSIREASGLTLLDFHWSCLSNVTLQEVVSMLPKDYPVAQLLIYNWHQSD